ncbi:MAG: hypothetical protein LBJ39_01685 [Tannerellaceae bacterium]|jgi:ABC-type phosphate transport system substrate-binding protein|nr:hypothetical protein [Tannerellaceae bacterium]
MKLKISFLLLLAAGISLHTAAQDNETVYIKSPKFATPLLEKWIAEYTKSNPQAHISVAAKPEGEADIRLLTSDAPPSNAFTIGRYAILPVAGKDNVALEHLRKKRLNEKRIKELFFEKDVLSDDADGKEKYNITVYSVNNTSPLPDAFAEYFGHEASDIKGKKIAGDDIYLLSAVRKDNTGICFNNLSYIFDTASRRLKDDIAILPLDLKKEYSEIIAGEGLDEILALLESKTVELIPVEQLTFALSAAAGQEAHRFIQWTLSEGQAFNHQFGFLRRQSSSLAVNRRQ